MGTATSNFTEAVQVALGAESWVLSILRQDLQNSQTDHLGEIWASELPGLLDHRMKQLKKAGFGPEDVAIVSCRGTKSTALADVSHIGKYKLRKFTNKYNANNEQIYTDGDLNFETIYRFKGQQAPCVILVDLDDTTKQDDWHTGILYCAMTRATVRPPSRA